MGQSLARLQHALKTAFKYVRSLALALRSPSVCDARALQHCFGLASHRLQRVCVCMCAREHKRAPHCRSVASLTSQTSMSMLASLSPSPLTSLLGLTGSALLAK